MRLPRVFSYHGCRAFQHPKAEAPGGPIWQLVTQAHCRDVGFPFQNHGADIDLAADKYGCRIWRTIGAHERPHPNDVQWPCDGLVWDLECGGNPLENALWFQRFFATVQVRFRHLVQRRAGNVECAVYSGYDGPAYCGESARDRYGVGWRELGEAFAGRTTKPFAWCAWWETSLPGSVRLPEGLRVIHNVALPVPIPPNPRDYLVEMAANRLVWPHLGLGMVHGVAGMAGARWGPADTRVCAVIGQTLAVVEAALAAGEQARRELFRPHIVTRTEP